MGIVAQSLSLLMFCKFLMWLMLTYYLVCPDDDCFHLDHGHFHHRKGWWKSRSKVPSTTCDCWCPEHPLLEASYLECSNIFPFRIFPFCFQTLHFYCLYSMQLLWWSSPVCSSSVCSMHCYTCNGYSNSTDVYTFKLLVVGSRFVRLLLNVIVMYVLNRDLHWWLLGIST